MQNWWIVSKKYISSSLQGKDRIVFTTEWKGIEMFSWFAFSKGDTILKCVIISHLLI